MEQHGTSSFLYNHDGFNALRDGEIIRVHLKPELPSVLCVCVCACVRACVRARDRERSQTRAPNVLSPRANTAFKFIVSFSTV